MSGIRLVMGLEGWVVFCAGRRGMVEIAFRRVVRRVRGVERGNFGWSCCVGMFLVIGLELG